MTIAWAIAYSATVLALAYAIPRGLAIWAQLSLMRNQLDALTETGPSSEASLEWQGTDPIGGGYV